MELKMKFLMVLLGSAVIGIMTPQMGLSWFNANSSINPKGAIVNCISVLIWVAICNMVIRK